jgi:hypothetical protein
MCDTLYLRRGGVALFGKNSDRPRAEPQIVVSRPRRTRLGEVRSLLDPLEADLWAEASSVVERDPVETAAWEVSAGRRFRAALERVAV